MSEHIQVARQDGVLRLVMARPEKKNALTGAMYDTMRHALDEAMGDGSIGVVLFEGAGGAFTAGNDLNDFLSYAGDFSNSPALNFVRAVAAFAKPMVAAVDGVAVGVGATMLLHCDLVYATPAARFRMPFVDLGVVPEAAASLLLPRRIGMARASEILLLGEMFDANHACEMGLINAVVPAAELSSVGLDKAKALARKPRSALLAARALMRGDSDEVARRVEVEATAFAAALRTPEALVAMQAFFARGK